MHESSNKHTQITTFLICPQKHGIHYICLMVVLKEGKINYNMNLRVRNHNFCQMDKNIQSIFYIFESASDVRGINDIALFVYLFRIENKKKSKLNTK